MSDNPSSFQWTLDNQNVATLIFDLPGEKINKFSLSALDALEKAIDELALKPEIKALVIKSGKKDSFIAGADLHMLLDAIEDRAKILEIIRLGHKVFNKLENLPFPTIAVINGACLGGGLEMALACKFRIASDQPKTMIGLPETSLGIIPGWGGTQRLPRLVGLSEGLQMILSAKPMDARKALKIHLIDRLFALEFEEEAIKEFVKQITHAETHKKLLSMQKAHGLKAYALEGNPLGRQFLFTYSEKELLKRTKGHYFAPQIALDLIFSSYALPLHEGLEKEIAAFSSLKGPSLDQAKILIGLFFTQEALKKEKIPITTEIPKTILSTGVIGAGTMGASLAWLFATNNFSCRIKDIHWNLIGKGLNHIHELFNKAIKNKKMSKSDAHIKFQKISPALDYSGFKNIDFVVEAAPEITDIKQEIFRELENNLSENAIIATNTSSLTVSSLGSDFKHPERFLGLHFFNPVNKMPLVEVVKGPKTSDENLALAFNLCRKLGKIPICVGDCPGFLVNRIFITGANEVLWMLQDGVPLERIDKILLDFGMPMSPFELFDEIGNDICYKASKQLEIGYGQRMQVPPLWEAINQKKLYGKKSSEGFYLYHKNKKSLNPEIDKLLKGLSLKHLTLTDEEILHRFLFIMVNEAWRCLDEKIVSSSDYLDMALIMGTGFPPFRGGLIKYANSLGKERVIAELKDFENRFGARFEPFLG